MQLVFKDRGAIAGRRMDTQNKLITLGSYNSKYSMVFALHKDEMIDRNIVAIERCTTKMTQASHLSRDTKSTIRAHSVPHTTIPSILVIKRLSCVNSRILLSN